MDLIKNILIVVKNVIVFYLKDIFLVDILTAFNIKIRDAKKL